MGVRAYIEKNKTWVVPLLLVLAIGGVAFSFWHTSRSNALPGPLEKAFFTVDGSTYFVDDLTKIAPFDHNGQQAYRAYVFQGPDGKPFVGLMGRQSKGDAGVSLDPRVPAHSASMVIEVKRPNDKTWVALNSAEGQRLFSSLVPGGHPEAVLPE